MGSETESTSTNPRPLTFSTAAWVFRVDGGPPPTRKLRLDLFAVPSARRPHLTIQVRRSIPPSSPNAERIEGGTLFRRESRDVWRFEQAAMAETPVVVGLAAFTAREGALLIHSTALLFRGSSVLLTGPSGSGKSTFATLMSDCPLLSDEFNVLKKEKDGRIFAWGTPLRSSCPRLPNNIGAPLGAILFPVKDTRDWLEPVPPDKALVKLAQQAVTPQVMGLKPPFKLLAEIARTIPAFNFHFRKDSACRRLLDELPLGKPARTTASNDGCRRLTP